MEREPLRNGAQRALHVLGLLGGWALFVYWWYLVAVDDWSRTDVALIIVVTLIVSPAITVGWVLHNLGIFRRKGPRMGQPRVSLAYPRDWNGRVVDADWQALAEAPIVAITVDGAIKRYTAETVVEPTQPRGTETEPA